MAARGGESEHPDRPHPASALGGEPADEPQGTLEEVTAAFDLARQALEDLHQTWDTGLRDTLRRLEEMNDRTDDLVRHVSGNLQALQRVANTRRTLSSGSVLDTPPPSLTGR